MIIQCSPGHRSDPLQLSGDHSSLSVGSTEWQGVRAVRRKNLEWNIIFCKSLLMFRIRGDHMPTIDFAVLLWENKGAVKSVGTKIDTFGCCSSWLSLLLSVLRDNSKDTGLFYGIAFLR